MADISRRGKSGEFTGSAVHDRNGTLVHWRIFGQDGKGIANVTANQFQRDGERMLQAYADGQPFTPSDDTTTFAGKLQATTAANGERARLLEQGRDHCYRVDPHVRELAREEYLQGGTFGDAVRSQPVEQWPGFERELFARLLGAAEAQPEVASGDQWLQAIHEQADLTSEWRTLEQRCRRDPWAAGIGAAAATRALESVIDEAIHKRPAPAEDPETVRQNAEAFDALKPGAGGAFRDDAEAYEFQSQDLANQLRGRDQELRAAFATAAQGALAEVTETQAALAALGAGDTPGVASRVAAPADTIRRALQSNPRLRRIALIAGRLRMRARAAQRSKVNYVPEQVVDVTLGAEVQRLLPSETVLLAEEETELLLMRRLLERQALQYRLEGKEALDRGPIILCVDGSGSMAGERHEWAMGLSLALLEVCAKQKRAFCLLHFDTIVQKEFTWTRADKLPWDKLVEMVTFFSNGGTSFAAPLARALQLATAEPRADVVLLTDGAGSWGTEVAELKARGMAVYGVALETDFTAAQRAELVGAARIPSLKAGDGEIDLVLGGV